MAHWRREEKSEEKRIENRPGIGVGIQNAGPLFVSEKRQVSEGSRGDAGYGDGMNY